MLPYDVQLRMKILERVIPPSDTKKIIEIAQLRYENNLVELANCIRLGKENIAIEEVSESLFIWVMLEETTLGSIGQKLGSSLLSKISNETMQDYLNRLEHILLES